MRESPASRLYLVALGFAVGCSGRAVEPSPSDPPATAESVTVAPPLEFGLDGFRFARSAEHLVVVSESPDLAKVRRVPNKRLVVSYEPDMGVDGPLCDLRAISIDALFLRASLGTNDLRCLPDVDVHYLGAAIDSRHDGSELRSNGVRGFALTTSFQGYFPRDAAALAGRIDSDRLNELSELPKLRWLDLSGSLDVSDDHLAILRALPRLRWISLEGTAVSAEAVREFRAARPELAVSFEPPQ